MKPIGVELMLLRGRLPEISLRPGMMLAAQVIERDGTRGLIRLAGVAVAAQLPEGVEAGDRLRLEVREAGAERLLLRITESPAVPAQPALALPLPDGQIARVEVSERDGGGAEDGAPPSVTVVYTSPTLGRLDLRLELPPGTVSANVAAPVGASAERIREEVGALREALTRVTGRPATVAVSERHDPFDTYA